MVTWRVRLRESPVFDGNGAIACPDPARRATTTRTMKGRIMMMTSTHSENVTDPICGMTVDPATAAAKVERDGTTYYFCGQGYADAFIADSSEGTHPSM